MNRLTYTIAAACSAALFASTAVADEQQMRGNACRGDVERLCKDVQPGEGRVLQCLKDNEASVSGDCKEHMAKMHERGQQRMREFQQACKSDLDQYCKDVPRGQGKVVGCLRDHTDNLSASCKEQLAQIDKRHKQMQGRMHGANEACKGDVAQFCQGVRPGGGRVAKCLKDNEAKLSDACKGALSTN